MRGIGGLLLLDTSHASRARSRTRRALTSSIGVHGRESGFSADCVPRVHSTNGAGPATHDRGVVVNVIETCLVFVARKA